MLNSDGFFCLRPQNGRELAAALTAFLTAITTTSCMGYGPLAL